MRSVEERKFSGHSLMTRPLADNVAPGRRAAMRVVAGKYTAGACGPLRLPHASMHTVISRLPTGEVGAILVV